MVGVERFGSDLEVAEGDEKGVKAGINEGRWGRCRPSGGLQGDCDQQYVAERPLARGPLSRITGCPADPLLP